MDPIPPEALLAGFPVAIRDLGERLRASVLDAVPDAVERVRPGWRLVGYDAPAGRRTAFFGFIIPEREHIHLGFEHGVLMHDPDRRLLGRGITRRTRWLTFLPGDDVDAPALAPLIREAVRVARLPRDERFAAAMAADARDAARDAAQGTALDAAREARGIEPYGHPPTGSTR
jgi:hypothetical protein